MKAFMYMFPHELRRTCFVLILEALFYMLGSMRDEAVILNFFLMFIANEAAFRVTPTSARTLLSI